MPRLTFIEVDGSRKDVEAKEGYSVMETALASGIDGIKAECGGSLACATCHCYVSDEDMARVGPAGDVEADMLDFAAADVTEASRLSCQIRMTADLDGLVVTLPDMQE